MRLKPFVLGFVGLFVYLFFPVALLQWMGLAVVVLVALSWFYARTLHTFVRVLRRTRSLKAHCFEAVDIELLVQNKGLLPVPYMSIIDQPGNLKLVTSPRHITGLGGRKQKLFRCTVKGYQRGAYRIGPIRVRFSDPLGFFPFDIEIPSFADVVIYPPVHRVILSHRRGLPAGNIRVHNPIYEDSTRYRSVRAYIPGDDLRQINWKVSARTGNLHSTEYLSTIYFPSLLVVNLTREDYSPKKRFQHLERTIEAAASVLVHMVKLGQSIGMVSSGRLKGSDIVPRFAIRSGHHHSVHMLEALARLEPSDGDRDIIDELFRQGKPAFGTRIMYFGPELRDEQIMKLSARLGVGAHMEFYTVDEQVLRDNELSLARFDQYLITEHGEDVITPIT